MTSLRVLDLFSGIGGFAHGLERTGGFETVAFCEIEPYASKVLKKWWGAEPDVGRVANGVPSRVDRLRGLGNAVVPEIPYRIGRAILKAEGLRP